MTGELFGIPNALYQRLQIRSSAALVRFAWTIALSDVTTATVGIGKVQIEECTRADRRLFAA